ncbi:hypothetical protein SRHO_G00053210 [Serrasalmus rhombeus]
MSTSTESSSQENCEPPSLIRKAWTETFQVPWNLMPVEVQTAISEALGNTVLQTLVVKEALLTYMGVPDSSLTFLQRRLMTLEVKRQKLEDIYGQEGVKGSERSEVKQLMETTFCLQCCHINALPAPAIADVRDKWPYLFTHFELLTDINVLRALEFSMEECGKNIVEFFKSKPTNDKVQAVLSEDDVELSLRVIQLLMAHFEESIEGLVLFENSFATAADLESMLTLPATPRLLLLGEKTSGRIELWMVILEGHIICEGIQPTFLTGLGAVFSTFYNFNLQYQEEAACTLEFIQRPNKSSGIFTNRPGQPEPGFIHLRARLLKSYASENKTPRILAWIMTSSEFTNQD